MSKRTTLFFIALLACALLGICRQTFMATWPASIREPLTVVVASVSLFYIGLNIMFASKTSLGYRVENTFPLTRMKPGFVLMLGMFIVFVSLLLCWPLLGQLK